MMDQTAAVLEENLASSFQPDTLLSAQYFENFRRKSPLEPEKTLMLAVLEDAIRCFQDNVLARDGKGKKLLDEAETWILETNSDWIFSFESVCEVLGFDPRYVREGLMRWKESKLAKRPKEGRVPVSFSIVPLLLAERELPAAAREDLAENRLEHAAKLLMKEYGLSCVEAGDLLDVAACRDGYPQSSWANKITINK